MSLFVMRRVLGHARHPGRIGCMLHRLVIPCRSTVSMALPPRQWPRPLVATSNLHHFTLVCPHLTTTHHQTTLAQTLALPNAATRPSSASKNSTTGLNPSSSQSLPSGPSKTQIASSRTPGSRVRYSIWAVARAATCKSGRKHVSRNTSDWVSSCRRPVYQRIDPKGVDVAAVCVDQARTRWMQLKGQRFEAQFVAFDCYTVSPALALLSLN